jgi:hypothetical protein
MWRWPSTTPGRVWTSTSVIDARWICAKRRICVCAKRMSSSVRAGRLAMQASICTGVRRKLSGDHWSNWALN